MAAVYEKGGLRFLYPENWKLEEDPTPDGWSVTVQSPETAFLTISVYPDRPQVDEVLQTVLSTLREDAPDLETAPAVERIAKHNARGHDINFFSMDLTNSAWTRSFRMHDKTILILGQMNDMELDYAEPVLRAIRASLEISS